MPTPDEKPSRVLRATTAFRHTTAEGEEVTVHNDNVHAVLADASDADLTALAAQGWIVLTQPLEG